MLQKELLIILLVTVIVQSAGATTPEECTMELKDSALAAHVVVENCTNVGVFSLGGIYNGSWEKLTYRYASPWPGTFLSIKVNDKIYSNSEDPNEILLDKYLVQNPTIVDNTITLKWKLPEPLSVEQTFSLFMNGTLITLKLKNEGSQALNVGVRFHIDTMLGKNDGTPIYIPGDGLKTNEAEYEGSKLNFPYWKAYNEQESPTIVATGIINPEQGMTYPDKLIVADWKKSKDTGWEYLIDTSRSIIGDSAVLLYYNNIHLNPEGEKSILIGYGKSEQVLPVEKGAFGITEVLTDKVSGVYCPFEKIRLKVDVLSANKSSKGMVALEIKSKDGVTLYNSSKPTGEVKKDSVKTITFEWTLPNITTIESFDVLTVLFDENNKKIDEVKKVSIIKVYPSRCVKREIKIGWGWLIPVIIIAVVVLVALMVKRAEGKVKLTKSVENGKVTVKAVNNTRRDLVNCSIEDKIPKHAEVDVTTMDVTRRENKLIWNLGVLKAGDEAVLEYIIRGVNVLPQAKIIWDGGEEISN